MVIRGLYVALTLLFPIVLACSGLASADEPQSVDDYYRGVLAQMSRLPEPPLVSYDVVVRASGATFYVSRDPENGEAEFGFSVGPALGDTSARWPVVVRTNDNATSVLLDNARAVTHFPAFNATWGGIDAWMRFGMASATPVPSASPPAPASSRAEDYRVIAVVRSLDLGIYRVRDGGTTNCDDKSPARLLHLTARDNASRHPATDISVQTATQTICTIRFELERSELVGRNGYVQLYIKQLGSYYLVDRGEISFDAGPKLGRRHVRLFLNYVGVEFPSASPTGAFTTPAPDRRR